MPRGRPKTKEEPAIEAKEKEAPFGKVIEDTGARRVPFELNPGDEVSLNIKQRRFVFLLGRNDFSLTPDNWHSIIPLDISDTDLHYLRLDYEAGDIVKGKHYLPTYPKGDDTIDRFVKSLKEPFSSFQKKVIALVNHKGLVEGYTPAEIIQSLIRAEQEVGPRKAYQKYLEDAMEHVGGITPITDTPLISITLNTLEEKSTKIRL